MEKDREEQYHEQENFLGLDSEIVGVVSTLRKSCARLEVEALELIASFGSHVEGRQATNQEKQRRNFNWGGVNHSKNTFGIKNMDSSDRGSGKGVRDSLQMNYDAISR